MMDGKLGSETAPRTPSRLPCLLCLILTLVLVGSCARVVTPVYVDASSEFGPRLADILQALPLPAGFAESSDPKTRLRVSLLESTEPSILPETPQSALATAPCGMRWLAPALPLADPRFDLSLEESRSLGLRDLASIAPPLRAPRVEGRWPGEPGYPFGTELQLRILARQGRLPTALRAWLSDAAARGSGLDTPPLVLSATGDLETGPGEAPKLLGGEPGFVALLGTELLARLRSSDLLVGNLEGQISSRGSPNALKHFHFRFPPGTAAAYRALGFDLLLLANNHALDFGTDALIDTLADLDKAELPLVGAGMNASEALAGREARGSSSRGIVFVGLAAFPEESQGFSTKRAAAGPDRPGINVDLAGTITTIAAAKARGAFVVALVHAGTEFTSAPTGETRRLFRRLAEAGADLVVGSHPHVLQGVEAAGGSLLAYSLGNFLFTGREMPPLSQKSALMSFLVYRGRARSFDLYPVVVSASGTRADPQPKTALAAFSARCAALNRPNP